MARVDETIAARASDTTDAPLPSRQDVRLGRAWDAIRRPDIRLISTDVFDTLLWRQVVTPVHAFDLLAERLRQRRLLAPHLTAGAFRRLRVLAEREARSRRAGGFGDLEANLREIYDVLPGWVFNHPADLEIAVETEVELERDLVVPDLDVVELLMAAAELGKTLIAVSNTYFTEEQLRRVLDQPGLDGLELAGVYTSCDHRHGKSGGLFEAALAETDIPPAATLHLGDDEKADIEPAERLGITTVIFERHPPELEELLDQERRFTEPTPAAAGGTFPLELTSMRGKVAARAEGHRLPPSLQPYWSSGALVQGPVLSGFAEWVQERGAELGARRLHCFMREGEFLTRLIDRAGAYLGLPTRCERLWLNREVLGVAAVGGASRAELEPLMARRQTPTVELFLGGIGLSLADLPRFVSHAATRLDDPVTRHNLIEAITDDDGVRAKVLAHAAEQRDRVVRYVEGLLDEDRRLFVVDLGWAASAQLLLRRVLTLAGRDADIIGLYLLTHDGAARCAFDGMQAWGFLGAFGHPETAVATIVRTPEILEQVCMPEHGAQVALDPDLRPILGPAVHSRLQAVQAGAMRAGVEAFQREWARYQVALPGKLPSLAGEPAAVAPLLLRQLSAPTEIEATLLGGWSHDENLGSDRAAEIADVTMADRLRHLSPAQLRDLPMSELYWPAGLAARVDRGYAELFAAASAGELAWDRLSADVESGPFVVEVARGVDVDKDSRIEEVPQRNRFGLSAVFGSITAPAIHELVLRPSVHPCVVRLDFLKVRCHVQGRAEVRVLSLESPEDFTRLRRVNCFLLNANVFVVHSGAPALYLDLQAEVAETVFRVDVECGFAMLPISELLALPGRLRSVEDAAVAVEQAEATADRLAQQLASMRRSVSWRLTSPLRILKRIGT
jgi:FMN phosphatase YigB (HAD superfamily)